MLVHNRDFVRLWSGETVSLLGTQVTELALPLTAILTLHASAFEIGLLNVSRFMPYILVSLFAGVWLDRHRRRPVLIAGSVGRAALIGTVPLLAACGVLSMELLYGAAFLTGVLTVVFDVGCLSYVPSLVHRGHLTDANSKLQASASFAGVGGPGLAGVLIGLLTAPIALVVDAVSYLVSAATLLAIRTPESTPETKAGRPSVFASIAEGLRCVFGNRFLRPLACQSATFNMFENVLTTVFLLYAIRELHLSPAQLGAVIGVGSVGALVGSLLSARIVGLLGFGRSLRVCTVIACLTPSLLLVPSGSGPVSLGVLAAALFTHGFGVAVFNVNSVTLRQVVTPEGLLARMNASYRMLLFGAVPLGALLGGTSSELIGLRATLMLAAVGLVLTTVWVVASPAAKLRELPDRASAGAAADVVDMDRPLVRDGRPTLAGRDSRRSLTTNTPARGVAGPNLNE